MPILRTIISTADEKNQAVYLHFSKPTKDKIKPGYKNIDLNKLMQNVGSEQFDFGTFKAAYDVDARVKTMVHNFNNQGIELKTKKNVEVSKADRKPDKDEVSKMAKSATDLGDDLT